jgi:hypothetical protein
VTAENLPFHVFLERFGNEASKHKYLTPLDAVQIARRVFDGMCREQKGSESEETDLLQWFDRVHGITGVSKEQS